MNDWIANYIAAQKAGVDSMPVERVARLIETLQEALRKDRQIFVFGNGGSAANASHFVTDLGKGASDKLKGRRFRCLSLNDNVSWLTALGNDYSYEEVYERQLMNYAQKGDVALALSVSGSSPNVVRAAQCAKQNGLQVVALVGGKGGKCAQIADQPFAMGATEYGQ